MKYKEKSEDSFDSIYLRYTEDVYRACLYLCRNEDLAQEVTQQAFINFYERFDEVKPECLKAYLIRAARNLMSNYYREHSKFVENDENGDLPIMENLIEESVEDKYVRTEERTAKRKLLDEILTNLKQNHKNWYDFFYAYYIQEKDYDEIATELDVTKDVLYSRARRAKEWIRNKYQVEFDNTEKGAY